MFSCCANSPSSEPAEVVKAQKVFDNEHGCPKDESQELFAMFSARAPLPPPSSGARFQKAAPMSDTSSLTASALNSNISGSRQSTAASMGERPTRFPRYNPDDVPSTDVNFEPGQQVGYQGFSGVFVRQISPVEQGDRAVLINIPGVGDKEVPMKELANEDHAAQRSTKELSTNGMRKEEKLQVMVKDFTAQAMQGMRVNLIDIDTRLLSQSTFKIDRQMTTLSLHRALGTEQAFQMRDLRSVAKGEAFKKKVPKLAHLSSQCVALEFAWDPENMPCVFFKDSSERDEFHLSMKVVMSMVAQH